MSAPVTAPQLAVRYNQPAHRIRMIADQLAPDLPRAGLTRLIPPQIVKRIVVELRRRGFLKEEEAVHV